MDMGFDRTYIVGPTKPHCMHYSVGRWENIATKTCKDIKIHKNVHDRIAI